MYEYGVGSGIIAKDDVSVGSLLQAHRARETQEGQAGGAALVSELTKKNEKAKGKTQTQIERDAADAEVHALHNDGAAAKQREAENALRGTNVGIDSTRDGSSTAVGASSNVEEAVKDPIEPETSKDEGVGGDSVDAIQSNVGEGTQPTTLTQPTGPQPRAPVMVQKARESAESALSKYTTEQRNTATARFVDFRNKNPDMAVLHDEFIVDKESDIDYFNENVRDLEKLNDLFRKAKNAELPSELIDGELVKQKPLTDEDVAAITFFERFERPEHAIEEIATRTQIDVNDAVPGASKVDLLPEADRERMNIATTMASFLEPFNKDTATLAEKWIATNLSPEVNAVYDKERTAASQRYKIRREQNFKLQDKVDPRPKVPKKGATAKQKQAAQEWDEKYGGMYAASGKRLPTMQEKVAEAARDEGAELNKKFNQKLETDNAVRENAARLADTTTLPDFTAEPISEVKGKGAESLDIYTDSEKKAVVAKTGRRRDDERALKIMANADVDIVAELYGEGFDPSYKRLYTRFLMDQHMPLDPVTMTMLEDNNLSDALKEYAKTASPASKAFARLFAKNAGNTRVEFADRGTQVAGYFDPRTNTITFNTNIPPTGHTLLHEVAHAVTAAEIQNNPQSAPVQTIRKVYEDLKDVLPISAFDLDEFVAEYYSNPEVRSVLSGVMDKGQYESARTRIVKAIRRIFQRLRFELGGPPPERRTILDMLDPLVDQLVNPAPSFRDSDALLMIANKPAAVEKVFSEALTNGPEFNQETMAKYNNLPESTARDNAAFGFDLGRRGILQITPLHYIVRLAKQFAPSAGRINDLMNQAGGEVQEFYDKVNAVNDGIVRWAKKSSQKDVDAFNRLNTVGTAYRVDPVLSPEAAKKKYTAVVYNTIYKPLKKDYVRLQKQRNGEGIKLYKQARAMFKGMVEELNNALDIRLEASGIPAEQRKTIRTSFYDKLVQGGMLDPYSPLKRGDGDYWFSVNAVDPLTGRVERYTDNFTGPDARDKAAALIQADAEKEINEAYDAASEMSPQDLQLPENAGAARIKNEIDSRINTGQFDRATAIKAFMNPEREQGLKISTFVDKSPPASFVKDLMTQLQKNPEISSEMREEIGNLVLDTLPETSYLQSFRNRKGGDLIQARMGFNQDSIKEIGDSSRSMVRQIVNMKYKAKLQQAFSTIQKEMEADPRQTPAKAAYLRALDGYVKDGAMPERSKTSRALTGVGFNMTLGLNVSGALVNLSQTPLVTVPYFGGKYGYGQTFRGVSSSMSLIKNSGYKRKLKTYGPDGGEIDAEVDGPLGMINIDPDALTKEQVKALKKMNINVEDSKRSLEFKVFQEIGAELGQFKRSADYELMDVEGMSGSWQKFNKITGFMQFHGERINREVALLTAYGGIVNKMSPADRADVQQLKKAMQQAVYETETTNGGIAAGAAPPLAKTNLGAVVFMYKRFGVSMTGMLIELATKMVRGSAKDRMVALSQMVGIYGSASLLAGVQGVPGFGLFTMAADTAMSLAGYDPGGEDDDAKTMVRAYLDDGPYKGAVNYYAGVNVASRIGLGELLVRDPMVQKNQPLFYSWAEQFGGPLVGIALNTDRGIREMSAGFGAGDSDRIYRAAETLMPAAMKNGLRAIRYSDLYEGGAYTRDGKPIIQDIHPAHIAGQFFGFTPTAYSAAMETNARAMRMQKGVAKRRRKLYDMYARAYFDQDAKGIQRALEKIGKYNQAYPDYPILYDNLERSIKGRIRGRETSFQGTTITPRLRQRILEDAARYGDPVADYF